MVSEQFFDDKIRFSKAFSKILKDTSLKECYHKSTECTNIIKAHSIQESRYLNNISVNGDVLKVFYDQQGCFSFQDIGKSSASTFYGFCKKHDDEIFKPIEDSNLYEGSIEQNFLFAYRASAKYYSNINKIKNVFEKLMSLITNKNDKELKNFLEMTSDEYNSSRIKNWKSKFESYCQFNLTNCMEKIKRLDSLRSYLNTSLRRKKYERITTIKITFKREYDIVATWCFFIEKDLKNNYINNPFSKTKFYKPLFITIFPQSGKTIVLLSFKTNNLKDFTFLDDQLVPLMEEDQQKIITAMLGLYCDNFYISNTFWEALPESVKTGICELHNPIKHKSGEKILTGHDINIFQ